MSANDQNLKLTKDSTTKLVSLLFLINKNTKVYDYIKFFIGEKQRFVIIIIFFFFEHNIVMNKQIKIVLIIINLVIQRYIIIIVVPTQGGHIATKNVSS